MALRMPVTDTAAELGGAPLGRLAAPEEVAQAALEVAKSLTFMTGAILPVDGGRPLG